MVKLMWVKRQKEGIQLYFTNSVVNKDDPADKGGDASMEERQPKTLGEKIRAARRELRMTQAELAGTDFTKSFISQVEKGFARPSIKSLQIIAARLNKPIGYFLDDTQIAPPAPTPAKEEHMFQSARALSRDGHHQDALALYEELLESVAKTEHDLRARAYAEMAQTLWALDRKLEAVRALEQAIELYQHSYDPVSRVQAISRLAEYVQQLNDQPRAAALCEQALTILREHHVDNPFLELKLQTDVGLHLVRLNQNERGRRHLEEAMDLAEQLNDYYRWGEICHALGILYEQENDLDKAQHYSMRAVRFYESVQNAPRKIQARINAASQFHRGGLYPQAWEQIDTALQEAMELDDPDWAAKVHDVRGRFFEKEERWEEAADAIARAIALETDENALIRLHRRRSRVLARLGRYDEAIGAAREAVDMLEKGKNVPPEQLAQAYSELGLLLKDAGHLEEAQAISMKSLELFRQLSDNSEVPG